MAALPQTGLQQAPVRDTHDKAAIARARLKACPADVAAAWAEDYPPPQSSFNDVQADDPPRRLKKKTCPRCFEGPGAYAAICIECPSPPPKRRRKEAVALAP